MTGELQLNLLGKPQATQGGEPLTGFISAKAEALLYYLAATGRVHARELLADLFWGEMPEASAKKNLTKALSNLRRLIGPDLLINHHSAGFRPDRLPWLDVRLFQETAEATEPEFESLRRSIALYQGDFLAGFSVKDAPVFEEWVLAEQQRLHSLLLQMLEILTTQLADHGDYTSALDYARRLLNLDPYRESAHRQMMLLLARTGQRNAALAQYESCRTILVGELGAEPMPETQALYNRLKATGPPPHNLPHSSTIFVGRSAELAKIIALLNDPACRLLTIAGPGGIGKTRLALQAVANYIQSEQAFGPEQGFPDGVYWVRLAPLDSIEAIVPTLAEALSFSFQTRDKPRQQLLNYLRQKSLLLVMDNFEHLLAAEAGKRGGETLLIDILENAPGMKILTTSLTRLNIQGEHIFYLVGMDYPEYIALEDIAGYGAVQLFLQSARRGQPDFALTPDNAQDVLHICRLAQGMPLAILLAAAWVELLTPAEIAAEISQSLDFLASDMRDLPPRQRSIRAVFDHSWELLTAREKEILAELSIFRGHFSRQAAQAVSAASLPELIGLVNKSLLRHSATGRYVTHEMLRQFALEKLNQSPDQGWAARSRHSAHYTAALEQLEVDLKGPAQQSALTQIEADVENIKLAWRWAVEQTEVMQLAQAMQGLGRLYSWRGRYQEGEAAFRLAAEGLAAVTSSAGLRVLAKLLAWQGIFTHLLGQTALARQLLEKSLAILDKPELAGHEIRSERAFALLHLGEIARESDRQQARRLYEQSLALYQTLADQWGIANTLTSLGWLVQHLGAYDEAKHLYEQSLTLRQTLQDRWGVAHSLISLGSIMLYQGYPEEAKSLVRQSITLRQELGDRAGIARSLSKLGETLTWLGEFTQAQGPLEESRTIYDDLGLGDAAAFSKAMLAQVKTHLGNYNLACRQAQIALAHFQETASQRGIGYTLLILGWASLAIAPEAQAQPLLQKSLAIYREIGQRDELAQALTLLGYAAYRLGDLYLARQHLDEALQIAAEIHAFMPMMLALPAEALLSAALGNLERAAELHALAWRYPFIANSRWFEDMAGQDITAAVAALPQEVVTAAQEQGRAKALEPAIALLLSR